MCPEGAARPATRKLVDEGEHDVFMLIFVPTLHLYSWSPLQTLSFKFQRAAYRLRCHHAEDRRATIQA